MSWKELIATLDEHFDAERCLGKIRAIYDTDHWFSYKRNLETADYCAESMQEMGLTQVEKLPLQADGKTKYGDFGIPRAWHATRGVLRFADSEGTEEREIPEHLRVLADYEKVPCTLTMYSPATQQGGVEAYVSDITDWSAERMQECVEHASDAEAFRGKMLLTNRPVAQIVAFANQVGAVGILSDFITLIPGVRNSREEFYDDCPWMGMDRENPNQVFGFHLTPRKGDFLRALLKEGPVKLFADIQTERYDGVSYTVSGALEGTDPSLPEVFAYGHLYEPGADDNASGSAALLELMQTFGELIEKGILPRPRRTIRIAVGNEYGGSMGYLWNHTQQKRLCGAVVDMVGTEKIDRACLSLRYNPLANWSFADAAIEAVNRIYQEYKGQEHRSVNVDFNMNTDNVIADPGMDMPTIAMVESPAFGYHSSMDRPDRIEPETLQRNAVIMGAYLYGLADADADTCKFLKKEIHAQIEARMTGQISERKKALWMEAGDRAVKSLERINKIQKDSEDERLTENSWTEEVPDYASEMGRLVPARKAFGCLSSSLWCERKGTLWENIDSVELNTFLFWADGKRNLWDIALHTAVEMNKCTDEEIKEEFMVASAFFADMEKIKAVEWKR